MSRLTKEKTRVRVVYEKTSGHLLIGDTNERLCPVIPSPVSSTPSQQGFVVHGNEMKLCEASLSCPGVVYAMQTPNNTGFGKGCLCSLLEAKENTAFGTETGRSLTDGCSNTFIGKSSGWKVVEGNFNTFLGAHSAGDLTKGDRNVFVGALSASGVISGQNNVFIGFNTKALFPEVSESVALGYSTIIEGNNELALSRFLFTVRARGLKRRGGQNSEMLTFDQESGRMHPIWYPPNNKNLRLLESSDVLALDVYQENGRATVCISDLEKLPQLSVTDEDGVVVGLSHSGLLLHLLFALQRISKEKGNSLGVRHDLDSLIKNFNEFRDSNFQNLSSINKTNEVLLAKLYQFSDISKRMQEISDRQTSESGKTYSLRKKCKERHEKQNSLNKVFGETLQQNNENLSSQIRDLSAKISERDEIISSQEKNILELTQKFETLSRVQDSRIRSLEEKVAQLLETTSKLLDERPVSPLCVSAVGELQKRTIPLVDVLEDWENISG
ncbi:hypothetical protein ISTM_239 [Insectomime virus]|nr:hypothetical protein ISTM_239 [Insectomime virus]